MKEIVEGAKINGEFILILVLFILLVIVGFIYIGCDS
ncbi:YjcZ family sporulation protein [Virgibacillus sp. DJP39]